MGIGNCTYKLYRFLFLEVIRLISKVARGSFSTTSDLPVRISVLRVAPTRDMSRLSLKKKDFDSIFAEIYGLFILTVQLSF